MTRRWGKAAARLRRFIPLLASMMVFGFGMSGTTTLAFRWLTEGWIPVFAVLLPIDLTALVSGCLLMVWLFFRSDQGGRS